MSTVTSAINSPILREVPATLCLELRDPLLVLLGRLLLVVVHLLEMLLQLISPCCPSSVHVQLFHIFSWRYLPNATLYHMSGPCLFFVFPKDFLLNRPIAQSCLSFAAPHREPCFLHLSSLFLLENGRLRRDFHLFLSLLEAEVSFRISVLRHLLLHSALASSFNSLHLAHVRRFFVLFCIVPSSCLIVAYTG